MEFKNNPFYVLQIPTTATRNEIISKAEEMSFFEDPDLCNNAQSILLNPAKRLEAEINWFPGLVGETDNASIIEKIDAEIEIPEADLESVAKLNAVLFNMTVQTIESADVIQEKIKLLDEIFDGLDSDTVLDDINAERIAAGIPETTREEVESSLNAKRETIRRTIDEKLEAFQENEYVDIVNSVAERFINNVYYDQGVVIDDVINQYEVRMQTSIEEKTAKVLQAAEEVEKTSEINLRGIRVNALIKGLKEWDIYAQPLQLKARAEGQMHSISENLARSIRNTSIYIHNELHDVENATKLLQALKDVFAELPEFMEIITSDAQVLEKNKVMQDIMTRHYEEQVKAQKRAETGSTVIRWVIRLAIIAAIIAFPTMCHDSGSDSSYDSSYEDEYYDDEYDSEDEDVEETTTVKQYVEEDMPESGYVFKNTCNSRPTYMNVTNTSSKYAYLIHVIGPDGQELYGFIRPNSTGQIYLPAGELLVRYEYGEKWYGEEDMFGDEGHLDGISKESVDSSHYYSITVPFEDE